MLSHAGRLFDELKGKRVPEDNKAPGDSNGGIKDVATLGGHMRTVWREMRSRRPGSFYILFAIVLVLLLGLEMASFREDPRRGVFILICMFVFFFAVMVFAVLDAGQILRRHLREQRKLWQSTLGDEEFLSELSKRVRDHRDT